jgi:hypothetical protein
MKSNNFSIRFERDNKELLDTLSTELRCNRSHLLELYFDIVNRYFTKEQIETELRVSNTPSNGIKKY